MRHIFKMCRKYLSRYWLNTLACTALTIASSLMSMVYPFMSGTFLDLLLTSHDQGSLLRFCAMFFCVGLASIIIGFAGNYMFTQISTKLSFEFNSDVIAHIQQTPLSFCQGQEPAYLNQRINNDTLSMINFCLTVLQNIPIHIILVFAPISFIYLYNRMIALIIVVMSCIYYLAYKLLKQRMFTKSYEFKESQAMFFSRLNEQLAHVQFLKMNGIADMFIRRLNEPFSSLLDKALSYQIASYTFIGLDNAIMILAQITIFLIGGCSLITGDLSIGQLTIILGYVNIVFNSVKFFFHLGKSNQDALVSHKRISSILNTQFETNGSVIFDHIDKLEVKQLCFSYAKDDIRIIENFNYTFKKGNMYAVTGENGSGKSTLGALLVGLNLDSISGDILYNDINIKEINMSRTRRELIAVAEQEPLMIADTLGYNLYFGSTPISDAIFRKTVSAVGLDSYMEQLSEGLGTLVKENANNLSGGERQKVSILRGLLKDPDLIVLDEPTSALDMKSISLLLAYLESVKSDKIVIIVTHNPDVIESCDYVIDLDKVACHYLHA